MKINFKKISAIGAGILMAGLTMGTAMAANYPAPFVSGGSANVAIVYGASAPQGLDQVQANNIQTNLQSKAGITTGGITSSSTVGGDSYKLEKSSTKFHLGDSATDVVSSSVTNDQLPTLLADGTYTDDSNNEFDYTQKITLGPNINLTLFDDSDYAQDLPTVGIRFPSGAFVLNYTLDFSDQPSFDDLAYTNLPLMGKEYYVLSVGSNNDSITLLDSAQDESIGEGESATLSNHTVKVSFITSDNKVKLEVDGTELSNTLSKGGTAKLSDGSYVGVKDVLYSAKTGSVSQAEVSVGSGKLVLTDGSDINLNEQSISGLEAHIVNGSSGATLDKIILKWSVDDDSFVASDSEVKMPGFGAVKLSYGGLVYPTEEPLKVDVDGDSSAVLKNFPLKDATETINVLYYNGSNYTIVGKDSDNQLATSGSDSLTFDADDDDWFVASWNDTQDSESYLVKVTNFKNESSTQKATFEYRKDGATGGWAIAKTDAVPNDIIDIGNVEFTVSSLDKATKVAVISATAGTNFHTLYSSEGMEVDLPWVNETDVNVTTVYANDAAACAGVYGTLAAGELGYNATLGYNASSAVSTTCTSFPATYALNFKEEDKNGNLGYGNTIAVTLGADTNSEVSVTGVNMGSSGSSFMQQDDSKNYRAFAYSDLATEAIWDKSQDQYTLTLTYHGSEVTADVYLNSAQAVVTTNGAGSTGVLVVKDSEVSTVASKNLIVVGGSCVNTAAASLVGGHYCGDDWTRATGVGSGQFLIKRYTSGIPGNSFALLVAGYEAADTANAATYLTTKTVDTSKGGIGTSATAALTTFS